jgi:magnesium chelatase family protein
MTTTRPCRAEALSIALLGLESHLIHIDVTADKGPPKFELVGFPEGPARGTRVRVRAALQQIGMDPQERSITVRLTPDNLPKSGASDMAIALAVLSAVGQIPAEALKNIVLLGELSLTGSVRPVRGVLPSLRAAVKEGITKAIVPRDNAREAANMPGIRVLIAGHMSEIVRFLREGTPLESAGEPPPFPPEIAPEVPDMADIRGLHSARRALEVAAAGGHNILFIGQPGAGKTMLARRLGGILPPLSLAEALEVTAIHSVAGLLSVERGFIHARPFRAPHHTVSAAGLVGGGDPVRPGEVTLAHHGVLFLDELPEFEAAVLGGLHQPLEEGSITICRARTRTTFPAKPLFIAAMNPCPCGYAGERTGRCTCSPDRVKSYRARLRGPFFDHFDLHIALPPLDVVELQRTKRGESSAVVQKRVIAARVLQTARAELRGAARTNADLSPRDLERFAMLDAAGSKVLAQAVERLSLSAGHYGRVLRVGRTIADLDGSDSVCAPHVAEAIHALPSPYMRNSNVSA